jgi:hypothetical protein
MFSSPLGIGAPPPAAPTDGEGATAQASAAAVSPMLMRAIEDTTEPVLALAMPKLCIAVVGLKIGGIFGNFETADAHASGELASFARSTKFSAAPVSQYMLIFIDERRQSH